MEGLLSFIVVGFALAGSPGPNTLSLAATGAAFGARRGLSLSDLEIENCQSLANGSRPRW